MHNLDAVLQLYQFEFDCVINFTAGLPRINTFPAKSKRQSQLPSPVHVGLTAIMTPHTHSKR